MASKADEIRQIWSDSYPPRNPRHHYLVEKIFCTLAILLRYLSLDNLRIDHPDLLRHRFMDIYVLIFVVALTLSLFIAFPPAVLVFLASYRIFDIVTYRVYFLLVKSQERPWSPEVIRRSVLIAALNFYEKMVAFAIIYLNCEGSIKEWGRSWFAGSDRCDLFQSDNNGYCRFRRLYGQRPSNSNNSCGSDWDKPLAPGLYYPCNRLPYYR